MSSVNNFVEAQLTALAKNYYAEVKELFTQHEVSDFYLAGGCFKSLQFQKDCDLDFFIPVGKKWPSFEGEYRSRNARSILVDGRLVQLCNYSHLNLKALVDSFDFNYCRCGVYMQGGSVKEVCFTEDYLFWLLSNKISYHGTAYPVSSLVRLAKIYKKNLLTNREFRDLLLTVLYDVAERGFKDHDDLRDQMDSIDLGHDLGSHHYRLVNVLPGDRKASGDRKA